MKNLPNLEDIIDFLSEEPSSIRQIMKAFNIPNSLKSEVRNMLLDYMDSGVIIKNDEGLFGAKKGVPIAPKTMALKISSYNSVDATFIAKSDEFGFEDYDFIVRAPSHGNLNIGDTVLAHVKHLKGNIFETRIIRVTLSSMTNQDTVVGLAQIRGDKFEFLPLQRNSTPIPLMKGSANLNNNAIVSVIVEKKGRYGAPIATLKKILHNERTTQFIALLGLYENSIPIEFSGQALAQAKSIKDVPSINKNREDLRDLPFVTIDGEDAKDFDDAVFAEKDKTGKGLFYIAVAIADVSHYVAENTPLDMDARKRGNSVYLPSLVVPMLPEELSNDLCSLRPMQDRATITAHMWIDKDGNLLDFVFKRSIIRSVARLTYNQVQSAVEKNYDDTTQKLKPQIKNLYEAWAILDAAKEKREALKIESTESKAILNEYNEIVDIVVPPVLQSHKVIEEFMILANVAAAQFLQKNKVPCMYRVHDTPTEKKIETLSQFLKSINEKKMPKKINNSYFNSLLEKFSGTQLSAVVNNVVLRSQNQAVYSPDNIGHSGLALKNYAHFTSPIRRYADLLVHRQISSIIDNTEPSKCDFKDVGAYISSTERLAMQTERLTMDRLMAEWLSEKIGKAYAGIIVGITKNGIYVRIVENSAEGFIPMRILSSNSRRLQYNNVTGTINAGKDVVYKLGQNLRVVIKETHVLSGNITFSKALSEKA